MVGAGIAADEIDRLAPGGLLPATGFAKVKHLSLEDTPTWDAVVFNDTPVEVLVAILATFFSAEVHSS